MDEKILFRTIIAAAILSIGTAVSMAQTSTGEVTGTISDQQGAFVAHAKVPGASTSRPCPLPVLIRSPWKHRDSGTWCRATFPSRQTRSSFSTTG